MPGKSEGRRRRGQQRMRWLDGITDAMDMSSSKLWGWWWTGRPGVLQSMGSQRVEHNWATELNWMYTPREKSDAYNLIQRYLFTEIITTAWHYLFHILSSIELWHFLQVLFQYLKEVNTLHLHHILSMSHTGTLTLPLKNLIANLCVYSKSNLTNWTNKI